MSLEISIQAVVFDLGGVIIHWDREHVYRELIPDDREREYFLNHVCSLDWVQQQDKGQPIAEGTEELCARFPQYASLIRAFYPRWHEMFRGAYPDGEALLDRLHAAGMPLYALTNWSAETFPYALANFPFLKKFEDVIVSGEEKMIKPDPAIFARVLERIRKRISDIGVHQLVFIDDMARNAAGAAAEGWHAIHHTSADETEKRLRELGVRF